MEIRTVKLTRPEAAYLDSYYGRWEDSEYETWRDLSDERRKELDDGGYDLFACMEYNRPPFSPKDIVRVRMVQEGERDGDIWEWIVDVQTDSRRIVRYYVSGGCDYTGWDCQSHAYYTEVKI